MKLYAPQFSSSLNADAPSETATTLVIASTPRSGSHMLGHALGKTGAVITPFEYCNPANLAEWKRLLEVSDTRDAIREIMRRRTNTAGIFSIKAHFSHCRVLGGASDFLRFFPNSKVVFIRRPDALRQAISYSVALQTQVWIDGQELVGTEARYDPQQIEKCLEDVAIQNACWTSSFAECGLTPLHVDFDRLQTDLPCELKRILRFTGIELPLDVLPETAPTRSQNVPSRTEDWVRRFSQEMPSRVGGLHHPSALVLPLVRRLRAVIAAS